MKKLIAFLCLLFNLISAQPMELNEMQVQTSPELRDISVVHDGHAFIVNDDSGEHTVSPINLSRDLRNSDAKTIRTMLSNDGYVRVNRLTNGEYTVAGNGRLRGGGPIFGSMVYWGVKIGAYSVIAAGVVTGVVHPAFGSNPKQRSEPIVRAGTGYVGSQIGAQAGAGTGLVGAGATYIGSTEQGREFSQAAVGSAAACGAGYCAGIPALIESVAVAAGAAAGMAPTP